jgi:renalase
MQIAIIGAGIAGLTAALHLSKHAQVIVYEKSRGFGGRAATRWHDLPTGGRVYIDHGAQYLKDDSPALHELIHNMLPTEELRDIARPVWTFDQSNVISEGDRVQNRDPKWTYQTGLAKLGRLTAEVGALNVKLQVRVGKLTYADKGYTLFDDQGACLDTVDHVLIAIPSGQAADLIAASDLPITESATLESTLRTATYRRCITVAFGYDHPILEKPYYALINIDRAHPLSWMAFEHDKPGHVPPGHAVIVAQMAGGFSLEHWDTDQAVVIDEVGNMVARLLNTDLGALGWTEYQKWRYSLPDSLIAEADLNGILEGLWFAGDYLRGGRVHLAAQTGYDVAQRIHQSEDP